MGKTEQLIRPHVEVEFQEELAILLKADNKVKPPNWILSPWAVSTYIMGGKVGKTTLFLNAITARVGIQQMQFLKYKMLRSFFSKGEINKNVRF